MHSYKNIKKYLDSFINYERKNFFPYKKILKLKRVKVLLNCLNIKYKDLKVIHIAGTKGKGSTATFCAYMLADSGFEVGLYTSPHLFDFRERIQVIKKQSFKFQRFLISKRDVIKIVEEIKPILEKLRFTKEFGKVSFFEVYTAIAFKYFLEKKVDLVVLETGLGGRLDATNVVKPLISIITHIGYDHTDKLGNTLAKISYEKAGIIKRKIPVVSSVQRSSVLEVLKRKCRKQKSKIFILNRDFFIENIRIRKYYSLFDFKFNNFFLKNLKISMRGKVQIENASLALAAILLIKDNINKKINIREGLKNAFIEGRFETLKKNPLIIADVSHNPSSFLALRENLKLYYPNKKIILIFAASKDKDIKNMLNKIDAECIILTVFSNQRAFPPLEIVRQFNINGIIAKNVKEAIEIAKKIYKKNNLILISGSLFLVSDAKKILN